MYRNMEQWTEIRRRVLVEGVSKRQILRETGMHWSTLKKILTHSAPPGYRQTQPRPQLKIGPYRERIQQILMADRELPRKQRHTAKRIWERLQEEGYTGGYTAVKEAVRETEQQSQEVFVPLVHRPGEAQVDFGEALVRLGGKLRVVKFLLMALPYSDAFFVMAFERECTETFGEGHVQAFNFFGGVPRRISYDNTRIAVAQIIGTGRSRKLTPGFLQLQSHYLFDHHFCRVRRPNEKGVVEGGVKFARLNFFVPVPQVRDMAELHTYLLQCCQEDLSRRLRGHTGTKAELLAHDREAFLPLPAVPFIACRNTSTTASSLSLVRFDDNDYSVPVRWAHHPVVVHGDYREVVLCASSQEVARHRRIWEREQVSFEPLHYLALLERKPGALDHARPLAGWELPECFATLRRRLENERAGDGTREYIRVLRLLEKHSLAEVRRAVEQALRVGAVTRDAVAQFLWPPEPWRATVFRLDGHPHLRHVQVAAADLNQYRSLLCAGGVR
jgi:transposase